MHAQMNHKRMLTGMVSLPERRSVMKTPGARLTLVDLACNNLVEQMLQVSTLRWSVVY